ncbi:MAG TPA: tetratricopeptide repeat protein [Sphingomicrobium sp.]|nr:tetratricopeptide repeat protein [Sphingomicrobium sp.]
MKNPSPSASGLASMSSLAVIAAALIAAAGVAVAVSRSDDRETQTAEVHGSTKPDQPVGTVEEKIKQLELRLMREPNDPAGWRMLGWSHFETGDLLRSAAAYRRAAEIEPGNAENWSSLGEALQTASTDLSPEAAAAFERALKLDPIDPRARYFVAVQKDLQGQHGPAVGDWIALLRDTPPGAPWEADLRRTILQVAEKHDIDVSGRMPAAPQASAATAAIPGPTPEQLAAASSIPPGQQSEMVKGMVERLANRLKRDPRDADGWMRLMRARMVLGDTEAAREAHRSGLAAFRDDPSAKAKLDRAARDLGVPIG